MTVKYLVGVDEAGRGPLAGPVAVAAVVIASTLARRGLASQTKDSKQLSVIQREKTFQEVKLAKKIGKINYAVTLVGHKIIDGRGIIRAVKLGISCCLRRLKLNPRTCKILLDGSLAAPRRFRFQETIIRGDATVPIIAAASIIAKVRRDRQMMKLAKKYPQYGFAIHKGYGTAAHYRALRRHGPSPLHRRTFRLK